MVEFVTFNFDELASELKERARGEGISNREAYMGLIDNLIADKLTDGELDPDNSIESIKQDLSRTWDDYKAEIS